MNEAKLKQLANDLLAKEFPELWACTRTKLRLAIGPNDLDQVEKFEADLAQAKEAARQTLLALSEDEVEEFLKPIDEMVIRGSAIRGIIGPDLSALRRHIPPPLCYGFGHPALVACDFHYWAQMPELRLHEELMVTVGVDPEAIDEDQIAAWRKAKESKGRKLFRAEEFLLKRHELLRRVFPSWIEGPTPANTAELY